MLNNTRVAIIGMGPMAIMLAHYALQHVSKITLFGKPLGNNEHMAGRAAGGMLAPAYECFGEYSDEFTQFALESRALWNGHSEIYGFGLDENGIAVASSKSMLRRLDEIFEIGRKFGIEIGRCDVPVGINAKEAVDLKCDALIDPTEVLNKVYAKLGHNSVDFCYDNIELIEESRITANNRILQFDFIIIASGYNSIDFSKQFPILENLVPIRGQTLLISKPPIFKGSLRNEDTYLMSRGASTAVGATSYLAHDWNIYENETQELYEKACALMPSLSAGKIIANFAGIRPQTKDGLPMLGQIGQSVWFAGGAYRNGWLLAPLLAKRLIESIFNNKQIEAFVSLSRFNS